MSRERERSEKISAKSKRIANHRALFKPRTKTDDDDELSYRLIMTARKTGKLNLVSRGLATGTFNYCVTIQLYFFPTFYSNIHLTRIYWFSQFQTKFGRLTIWPMRKSKNYASIWTLRTNEILGGNKSHWGCWIWALIA